MMKGCTVARHLSLDSAEDLNPCIVLSAQACMHHHQTGIMNLLPFLYRVHWPVIVCTWPEAWNLNLRGKGNGWGVQVDEAPCAASRLEDTQ